MYFGGIYLQTIWIQIKLLPNFMSTVVLSAFEYKARNFLLVDLQTLLLWFSGK